MSNSTRTADATRSKRKERDSSGPVAAGGDNRLLAGCLAHEFLTRGTLLGKRWGSETAGGGSERDSAGSPAESTRGRPPPPSSYAEVTYLLKAEAARIPGVVNPTQLARWLER